MQIRRLFFHGLGTMMVCELAFAKQETRDLFSFRLREDNEKCEQNDDGEERGEMMM